MHWDGELRGVLAVGYFQPHLVTREQLGLLEAFAELAAAACRNASAHAGLVLAARTDALTGCLNHAALHDALRREIERCERTGHRLSLVMVDLDDFKRVNEEHGPPGRRRGAAAASATRCARPCGPTTSWRATAATSSRSWPSTPTSERRSRWPTRALEGRRSLEDVGATARRRRMAAGRERQRADRAARTARCSSASRRAGAASAVRASELPEDFVPIARRSRRRRRRRSRASARRATAAASRPSGLRKRTRQLALANALAARVSAMSEAEEIVNAAAEELHRAFGYFLCAVLRDARRRLPGGRREPRRGVRPSRRWRLVAAASSPG